MKKNNLNQVGGSFAIIVALGFILIGVTYLLMPETQRPGGDFETFMLSVAADATMYRLNLWARVIVALAGFAAIPAIIALVKAQGEGLAIWASNLGYLALAVMAIESLRLSFLIPIEAQVYAEANDALRQMIGGDNLHATLDPYSILQFGVFGLSILLINLLALRMNELPREWAFLGLGVSILLWLPMVGSVLGISILITVASTLGAIILGPLWFVWIGILLRRKGAITTNNAQLAPVSN